MCFSANKPGKNLNYFTKFMRWRALDIFWFKTSIDWGSIDWLSLVSKQQVHPALVNRTLQKLSKINSFYNNITIDYW